MCSTALRIAAYSFDSLLADVAACVAAGWDGENCRSIGMDNDRASEPTDLTGRQWGSVVTMRSASVTL